MIEEYRAFEKGNSEKKKRRTEARERDFLIVWICVSGQRERERKRTEREEKAGGRSKGQKGGERRAGPSNEQQLYTSSGFLVGGKIVHWPATTSTRAHRIFPFPFKGSHLYPPQTLFFFNSCSYILFCLLLSSFCPPFFSHGFCLFFFFNT